MPHSGTPGLSEYVEWDVEEAASAEARQTYAYWTSLRPDAETLPPWHRFDWAEIPAQMIACCGVVDVVGGQAEFVYRFWGTRHVDMHGQELTNKSVHLMRPISVRDNVLDQYRLVCTSGQARFFKSTYRNRHATYAAREFSLRLPFSDDGTRVSHIFALSDVTEDFEYARKVCEDENKRREFADLSAF